MEPVAAAPRPGTALEPFRRELILSWEQLWVRYIGLGGMAGIEDLTHYLAGEGQLSRLEHNTIAQALNEQFVDMGMDHPVPYLD